LKSLADIIGAVVGKGEAKDLGKCADNLPVLASIAGRVDRGTCSLDTALCVHVRARLFGVGSAGEDDIGIVGTGVTVVALVDYKAVLCNVAGLDLVSTEQIQDFIVTGLADRSVHTWLEVDIEGGGLCSALNIL